MLHLDDFHFAHRWFDHSSFQIVTDGSVNKVKSHAAFAFKDKANELTLSSKTSRGEDTNSNIALLP